MHTFIFVPISYNVASGWIIEVVKASAKPFLVTFNTIDALLYTEDMGPVIFFKS